MSDALVSYAALILADAGVEITSEKLLTLTQAAGAKVDQVCFF
jgi:large subunit ribosomal protein LP1